MTTADSDAAYEEPMPMEAETAAAGGALTATLTGAEEVPGPGDEDGAGTARLTRNAGELCYELSVQNIDPAVAAHVHSGAKGVAGPPVVTLDPPAEGSSQGCVAMEQAPLDDVFANPGEYYVNVHNPAFPPGAVRGQLAAE